MNVHWKKYHFDVKERLFKVATLAPANPSALYSEDRHGRDWEEEFRYMYRPSGEAASPRKFALPLITPMQNQKERGSCW